MQTITSSRSNSPPVIDGFPPSPAGFRRSLVRARPQEPDAAAILKREVPIVMVFPHKLKQDRDV
jgi:hypothetical protein